MGNPLGPPPPGLAGFFCPALDAVMWSCVSPPSKETDDHMKYEATREDGDWRGRIRVTAEPNDELYNRGIQTLDIDLRPSSDQKDAERVANIFDDKGVHVAGFVVQAAEDREQTELERQADVALKQYLSTR